MKQSAKKKILFITPLAARTGSEVMLWHILKHFDRDRFEVAVASYKHGELLKEVPEDVRVFHIPGTYSTLHRIQHHLLGSPIRSKLKSIQKDFAADIWYLNTIVLPEATAVATELQVPFVTHFHEMPLSYVYIGEAEFERIIHKSAVVIGCSQATCQGIKNAGAKQVSLLHSFIETRIGGADPARIQQIRAQLGIGADDYVWIMSGTTSERKGFDYFPQIAQTLNRPNVHLVWVGSRLSDGFVYSVENQCRLLGSDTKVHMVGAQKEHYNQYLHLANGFVLTSRQDPFPLVMLEAAALGKPVVAFPSGGVSEFIVPGMGLVTENFRIEEITRKMSHIMDGVVNFDAHIAKSRAAEFNVEKGMKKWSELMNSVASNL